VAHLPEQILVLLILIMDAALIDDLLKSPHLAWMLLFHLHLALYNQVNVAIQNVG